MTLVESARSLGYTIDDTEREVLEKLSLPSGYEILPVGATPRDGDLALCTCKTIHDVRTSYVVLPGHSIHIRCRCSDTPSCCPHGRKT